MRTTRPRRIRASLPASPETATLARTWVSETLEVAGWPAEARRDVVLAVDEAVENAVEHGSEPRSPVELHLDVTAEGAQVLVRDRGRAGAHAPSGRPRPPDPTRIRGRGRTIIAALADSANWERHGDGTQVRFSFPDPRHGSV